jgi:hypothetical protein
MKKTLLRLTMVAALIGTSLISNAQDGRFSLGLELAMPMGDFADGASVGYGASARYEMPVGDNLGLTLTAGYLMFGGKDEGPDYSMIPVQVGAKYYFNEQQAGLYLGVELGMHSFAYTIPAVEFNGVVVSEEQTVTDTYFSYAPQVGYHLANIDLGLRYQIISSDGGSTSYLGLRAAYVFGGK